MPRLGHGATIGLEQVGAAGERLAERSRDVRLAFAAATPVDPTRFDFLFADLQNDVANLLPESSATRHHLVELGRAMRETAAFKTSNSPIPAAYTYLGQFIDHDITLETQSAGLPTLLDPSMAPLSPQAIRETLFNIRTATLDLDSVYGLPAPRVGPRMKIGTVAAIDGNAIPLLRPPSEDGRQRSATRRAQPGPALRSSCPHRRSSQRREHHRRAAPPGLSPGAHLGRPRPHLRASAHAPAPTLSAHVIATFDTKFQFHYWRPITAIRAGDNDGNWATKSDPNWSRSA